MHYYTESVYKSKVVIPAIRESSFVYNICLISISATVSDGTTKTLVLNIEHDTINCSKEFEPDVLNAILSDADLRLKIVHRMCDRA